MFYARGTSLKKYSHTDKAGAAEPLEGPVTVGSLGLDGKGQGEKILASRRYAAGRCPEIPRDIYFFWNILSFRDGRVPSFSPSPPPPPSYHLPSGRLR